MTTTYTFDQLKDDVRKEAEALRVHATQEERGRLTIDELSTTSFRRCYYGLMTGNCYSKRAAELIEKCCCRYFRIGVLPDIDDGPIDMSTIQKNVNGISVNNFVKDRITVSSVTHYSAIEAYILLPEAKNANLIAYLRGETETLEL